MKQEGTAAQPHRRTAFSWRTLFLCVGAAGPAVPALAQCPDGSPPPCRGANAARRDPTLDERAWLVLPFTNTSGASDAVILTQASVNLLYQSLARWEEVRVVSDDRVADLLRSLPAADRERPGLQSGLVLARRVGAGRLVLGDFLAVGGQAQLTATVYDTRSGRQVRVAREQLASMTSLDSLAAGFGRLARGVLALPDPATGGAGVGTSSLEAYRAYAAGMDALNRLALDSATIWFDRAIGLDSSFALPRLRRWQFAGVFGGELENRRHLEAALRLAPRLPPRERTFVEALAASARRDYPRLCASAHQLVAQDSTSAEPWALLAACYRNPELVADGPTARLLGDPTRALRAAQRAYALAPTTLLAIGSMLDMLEAAGTRMVCVQEAPTNFCPPERNFQVSTVLAGDSFLVTIRPWSDIHHAPPDRSPQAIAGMQRIYEGGREVLERLALLQPNMLKLNNERARLALHVGELEAAERLFGRGTPLPIDTMGPSRNEYLLLGLTLALALERPGEAATRADSFLARPGAGNLQYQSLFGRFAEGTDTSVTARQNSVWRQILAGLLPPGFDSLEARILARLQDPQREDFRQLSTLAAFHLRRTGPALDTAARHPLKRYQAWAERRELTHARAALAEFDRELTARHPATPDDGGWLFSAESHLELGDSSVALERMREFGRRWPLGVQDAVILDQWYFHRTTVRLWGRSWLLYADLAAAAGRRPEARRAYRMVVGLWERGDPPVQPMVARARAELAQLQ